MNVVLAMMMQAPDIYSVDGKELGWSKSHLSLLWVSPGEKTLPTSTALWETRETVVALWSRENFLASSPGSHSGADDEVSHRVLGGLLLGVWD